MTATDPPCLRLAGDWSIHRPRPLRGPLEEAFRESGGSALVVDGSEIGKWDLGLVAWLVGVVATVREEGGDLRWQGVPEGAVRLVEQGDARPPEPEQPSPAGEGCSGSGGRASPCSTRRTAPSGTPCQRRSPPSSRTVATTPTSQATSPRSHFPISLPSTTRAEPPLSLKASSSGPRRGRGRWMLQSPASRRQGGSVAVTSSALASPISSRSELCMLENGIGWKPLLQFRSPH